MRIKYVLIGFVLVVLAAICGVAIGLWVFQNFKIYIPLENQAVDIDLQEPLQASVQIHDTLNVNVSGKINAQVPIRENLNIPIKQTLNPRIYFDNQVPIKTVIPVRETLQVDEDLAVDTKVQVKILGKEISLPLKGIIPIKLNVPIKMDVPLEQEIRLKFEAPVQVRLLENLKIPLSTDIDARIPVEGQIRAPIQSALNATVHVENTLPIKIRKGEMLIPLNTLTLQKSVQQPGVVIHEAQIDASQSAATATGQRP